jgi:hypothetical protein
VAGDVALAREVNDLRQQNAGQMDTHRQVIHDLQAQHRQLQDELAAAVDLANPEVRERDTQREFGRLMVTIGAARLVANEQLTHSQTQLALPTIGKVFERRNVEYVLWGLTKMTQSLVTFEILSSIDNDYMVDERWFSMRNQDQKLPLGLYEISVTEWKTGFLGFRYQVSY